MSDNYQATFGAPLTRAELVADNPYVPQFEFLQESDESLGVKVGPGYWNDLPYLGQSGVKVYRALLTQSGTSAPVATVFENTLGGNVVWTRDAVGSYAGTLAGAFPTNSTFVTGSLNEWGNSVVANAAANTNDNVRVLSYDMADPALPAPADSVLNAFPVQILVYP